MRRTASVLLVVPLVVASCRFQTPPPAASVTGELRPSGVVEGHVAPAGPGDAASLLERAERAMRALDTFEQHVYSAGPLDRLGDEGAPLWELWDTEYRHERPDRLRIVVRTAWVGQALVYRRPTIEIHIGEHAWTRDLRSAGDGQWSCSDGGVTELPLLSFASVEGETAEYLGLERIGDRAAHVVRVKRPAVEEARQGASDAAVSPPDAMDGSRPVTSGRAFPPTETRYWIEPETFLVLRMEVDYLEADRSATTEVREFGAFDTPPEIFPPAPCATPTT